MNRRVRGITTTSSTRERYDLATKLGAGHWLSQGSYPTVDAARARARQWLDAAGPTGSYHITDEIGRLVESGS